MGRQHCVQIGDQLNIFHQARPDLPREAIASAIIIDVRGATSTIKILGARDAVDIGSEVQINVPAECDARGSIVSARGTPLGSPSVEPIGCLTSGPEAMTSSASRSAGRLTVPGDSASLGRAVLGRERAGGRSSVVERLLAMQKVVGSSPIARSNILPLS